jgi:hypothetical protein
MSSRNSVVRAWTASFDCEGCGLGIYPGSLFYTVVRGFMSDLVAIAETMADHWHLHCLDTITLLVDQLPGETIAVTLHQA